MDVIRDRSIVQLNRNQVRVLDTNLMATRDRFEVGDRPAPTSPSPKRGSRSPARTSLWSKAGSRAARRITDG